MQISVIKTLAGSCPAEVLKACEAALLEGNEPPLPVEGADEGEKLTHVLAAIWVKEELDRNGNDLPAAIRAYSQKVRKSIS